MLKFKIAQGLFNIISNMNHLCREAVNCWVLQVLSEVHALLVVDSRKSRKHLSANKLTIIRIKNEMLHS